MEESKRRELLADLSRIRPNRGGIRAKGDPARRCRFEIANVTGYGRNVTEAREDAIRRAAAALEGDWPVPYVFAWRGWTIMVWRDASGYAWKAFQDAGETHDPNGYSQSAFDTFDAAKQAARRHLAAVGWTPEDGVELPEWLTDRDDRAQVASQYLHYARYYEACKIHGLKDNDAHDYAGCNPGNPQAWKGRPTRYPMPGYPPETFPPLLPLPEHPL